MAEMTRLYFLRHGPALARNEWDGEDSLRPLSAHGEDVVRDVARSVASLQLGLEALLTSPYERALRTAVIVHQIVDGAPTPTEEPGLVPGAFTLDSLAEMLRPYERAEAVMVVGHEPSMTEVISAMIGGGRFVLRKGGLARVDVDAAQMDSGVLKWFAPPRVLRA